jgi:hypothetical protein
MAILGDFTCGEPSQEGAASKHGTCAAASIDKGGWIGDPEQDEAQPRVA